MSLPQNILIAVASEIASNYTLWKFDAENVDSMILTLHHTDDKCPDVVLSINYKERPSPAWNLDDEYHDIVLPFFKTSGRRMVLSNPNKIIFSNQDIETVKTLVSAMRL